jgi:hypothetical protein
MILSLPRLLGRRRGEVKVGVGVIRVGVIGVIIIVFGVGVILVLLLRVLLLEAPQRTIIKRPLVGGGDVFLRLEVF